MKVKVIEGQPKFRITLSSQEAEWLHAVLDMDFERYKAHSPECREFVENLQATLGCDLNDLCYDTPEFEDVFSEVEAES